MSEYDPRNKFGMIKTFNMKNVAELKGNTKLFRMLNRTLLKLEINNGTVKDIMRANQKFIANQSEQENFNTDGKMNMLVHSLLQNEVLKKQPYNDLVYAIENADDNLTSIPMSFHSALTERLASSSPLNFKIRVTNDLVQFFPLNKIDPKYLREIHDQIKERGFKDFVIDHTKLNMRGLVSDPVINFFATMGLLERNEILDEVEKAYLAEKS